MCEISLIEIDYYFRFVWEGTGSTWYFSFIFFLKSIDEIENEIESKYGFSASS